MELLLKQQVDIIELNSKNSIEGIESAVNQHAAFFAKNDKLRIGVERKECKKCGTYVYFVSINGCFCADCGKIFPF